MRCWPATSGAAPMPDRFRPIDDFSRYLEALESISDLVLQCAEEGPSLSRVRADKLATLLWLVLEGLEKARDGLSEQLHA